MSKKPPQTPVAHLYHVGDEISYAAPNGIVYGTVIRVIHDSSSPAVEIEFEDGKREVKKARDRALHIVRRSTGKSEIDERRRDPIRQRDSDIEEVRRSDQRRGSRR